MDHQAQGQGHEYPALQSSHAALTTLKKRPVAASHLSGSATLAQRSKIKDLLDQRKGRMRFAQSASKRIPIEKRW